MKTALLTAATLLVIAASPVLGATVYATVTGYAEGTSDNNHEDTWDEGCEKSDPGGSSYVLTEDHELVVVKAGSGQYANILFANASAGETVWADTNGNGVFDPRGQDGDKQISHIIQCSGEAPSSPPDSPPSTPPATGTDVDCLAPGQSQGDVFGPGPDDFIANNPPPCPIETPNVEGNPTPTPAIVLPETDTASTTGSGSDWTGPVLFLTFFAALGGTYLLLRRRA